MNASQNLGRGLGHVLGIGLLGAALGVIGTLPFVTVPDIALVWHDEQGRRVYGLKRGDTQQRLDQALERIGEFQRHANTRHYRNAGSGPHGSLYVRAEPSGDAPFLKKIPANGGGIVSSCNIEVVEREVFVEAYYKGTRGWVKARWLAPPQ